MCEDWICSWVNEENENSNCVVIRRVRNLANLKMALDGMEEG